MRRRHAQALGIEGPGTVRAGVESIRRSEYLTRRCQSPRLRGFHRGASWNRQDAYDSWDDARLSRWPEEDRAARLTGTRGGRVRIGVACDRGSWSSAGQSFAAHPFSTHPVRRHQPMPSRQDPPMACRAPIFARAAHLSASPVPQFFEGRMISGQSERMFRAE
jgi:hypothetical protein